MTLLAGGVRITALVDGRRQAVLRFRGDGDRSRSGNGGHATALRLTVDGQASLDRAAGGNVFHRGEVLAWAGR